MERSLAAALLALAGLACAGGFGPAQILAPEVLVADVVPVGGGLFEQRIRISFRVTNPNDFDLDVRGLSFRLDMNGEPLARGVSNEGVVLPALGEALVTAEASTTTFALLHQLQRLSERRELAYELSGRFHLSGLGVPYVSFERAANLGPGPTALPPAR